MFARLFAVASLAALAVAGPLAVREGGECSNGYMSCCNSTQTVSQAGQLFGLLGIADILVGATGRIGLGCSPITAIGTGSGASCNQQAVCCSDQHYNGLINMGCSPMNLNF